MKRYGLILATLFSLLVTGVVLAQTAWFGSRPPALPRKELHDQLKSHDPLASQAALRWRSCQPSHWRACLLQP